MFTAEEEVSLTDLRTKLVDSGDADLASSLDLLRLGSADFAAANDARLTAKANLTTDSDLWAEREKSLKNRDFWRSVRDGGLILFSTSTVGSLLLAFTLDREEGYMRNGFFTDWSSKKSFNDGLGWAMLGTATTTFLSLFPLLWGEARQ